VTTLCLHAFHFVFNKFLALKGTSVRL
jgi:hypothetical protein